MAPLPDLSDTQKAGLGGAASGVVADATIGLDRAWEAAGDVLSGIFGGAPWNLDPSSIVDAVTGGANAVLPHLEVIL